MRQHGIARRTDSMSWTTTWISIAVFLLTTTELCHAAMELPQFEQMRLLYPGYKLNGGEYRDRAIIELVGGHSGSLHLHNTAALRLSWTLNRYNGRHAIGDQPIHLTKRGQDSYPGKDGNQYIFRNTAFGPFLAAKYGNPIVIKPNKHDISQTLAQIKGKQGIANFVSYKKHHSSGHIALWDCDHFHQSRDWTTEKHLISVEFWETPDSYCPPSQDTSPQVPPKMMPLDPNQHLVARHNLHTPIKEANHVRHSRAKARSKTRHPTEFWLQ